jgi:hypothetical protein
LAAGVGRAPLHKCRKAIAAIPPLDFRCVIRDAGKTRGGAGHDRPKPD